MTYTLHRLAPGSYDLVLGGEVVGSVVREVRGGAGDDLWHAELLDDPAPEKRPPPFSQINHTFGSLQAVVAWLREAKMIDSIRSSSAQAACADN